MATANKSRSKAAFLKPLKLAIYRDGKRVRVVEFTDPRIAVCERLNSVPGLRAKPIGGAR